jgi:cytoskeletal protein CcmA (bactofilin family)
MKLLIGVAVGVLVLGGFWGFRINGAIHVDKDSDSRKLVSVNGSITVDAGAVAESVWSANGAVTLRTAAVVRGDVIAANGALTVGDNVHIGGMVQGANGNIQLGKGDLIDGGILVRASRVQTAEGPLSPRPTITIGEGTVVNGVMTFERPVRLYIHEHARVGVIKGATPIYFNGDAPSHQSNGGERP